MGDATDLSGLKSQTLPERDRSVGRSSVTRQGATMGKASVNDLYRQGASDSKSSPGCRDIETSNAHRSWHMRTVCQAANSDDLGTAAGNKHRLPRLLIALTSGNPPRHQHRHVPDALGSRLCCQANQSVGHFGCTIFNDKGIHSESLVKSSVQFAALQGDAKVTMAGHSAGYRSPWARSAKTSFGPDRKVLGLPSAPWQRHQQQPNWRSSGPCWLPRRGRRSCAP